MRSASTSWSRLIITSTLVVVLGVALYHVWVVRPSVRKAQAAAEAAGRDSTATSSAERAQAQWLKQLSQTLGRDWRNTAVLDAWQAALDSDLQTVRSQLELYKVQHQDRWPTLKDFVSALTKQTDVDGKPVESGFGPYLHQVPTNPFSGGSTVGGGPVGGSDWYYNEKTGEFRANHVVGSGRVVGAIDRPVSP